MNCVAKIFCNNKVALLNEKKESYVVTTENYYNENLKKDLNENRLLESNNMLLKKLGYKRYKAENEFNTLFYNITEMCNLQCKFCCMSTSLRNKKIETIDKGVIIKKIIDLDVRRIIITGGEPLMVENLSEILECLSEKMKCKIILQTNGTLLKKSIIDETLKYTDMIDISIQHMFINNLMEGFKTSLENLDKSGIKYGFSFLIDSETQGYIYDAIDLAFKHSASINIKTVDKIGHAIVNEDIIEVSDDIKVIYSNIAKYIIKNKYFSREMINIFVKPIDVHKSCGGYGNILSLRSNGNIYMCHSLTEDEFKVGNINELKLNEVTDELSKLKNKDNVKNLFNVDSIDQCNNCKLKGFCQGPCAAERFYNNNENKDCTKAKMFLLYNLFYFDKNKDIEENLRLFIQSVQDYDSNIEKLKYI